MTGELEGREVDLRKQLRAAWSRGPLLVGVVLLFVTVAVGASLMQEPLYEGTAKVLLPSTSAPSVLGENAKEPEPDRRMKNEIQVVRSPAVAAVVAQKLGPGTNVAVLGGTDDDFMQIKGRGHTRTRAAIVTQAYTTAYIDYERGQWVRTVSGAIDAVRAQIDGLQRELDNLNKQIVATDPTSPARRQLMTGLVTQRDELLSQQSPLRTRLSQLQLASDLQPGVPQLVTTAAIPTTKVSPHPVRTGVAAFVLGSFVAIAVALLVEYVDDSINTRDDLEQESLGLPVAGVVPKVATWNDSSEPLLVTLADPRSRDAEAYRTVRTSLQFLGVSRTPRVWQVTSCHEGDGKTTVVSNLAVVMAQAGKRVALVDVDLRRARVHEFFGLSHDPGFTSAFIGESSLEGAARPAPNVENLVVMTSGPLPANPSEVVASPRTAEILTELRSQYDIVLVDSPPVLAVSDAVALTAWVDATLLVVRAGSTKERALRLVTQELQRAGAFLAGTVLNAAMPAAGYGYGYGYPYRHSTERTVDQGPAAEELLPVPVLSPGRDGNGSVTRPPVAPPTERGAGWLSVLLRELAATRNARKRMGRVAPSERGGDAPRSALSAATRPGALETPNDARESTR